MRDTVDDDRILRCLELLRATERRQLRADAVGASSRADAIEERLREGVLAPDEQSHFVRRTHLDSCAPGEGLCPAGALLVAASDRRSRDETTHTSASSPSSTASRATSRARSRA